MKFLFSSFALKLKKLYMETCISLYNEADKQILKIAEDSLSKAPVTPLIVKDRKLNHHTVDLLR
jgi:uncharacterized metal-binding protein